MNALILAAGFGSRLMPLTKDNPKCMVEFRGKKIIDYEIEALKQAGVKNIAVVGGYLFEVLKNYVSKTHQISKIYENKEYDKSNMVSTFFKAREFMEKCIEQKQDLLVSYADIIYFKESVLKLQEANSPLAIVVDKEWKSLWQKRFQNPLEDAETLKIKEGKIIELGKKPKNYEECEAQYIGLFKISYGFLEEVMKFYEKLDKNKLYDGKDFANMYMTSFLQSLIDTYANAKAVYIYGKWCEIDFKSDLEISYDF
ncbi:sugar nucleotidyltransferase [Helicobacter valdiviensis]|uniref:Sugar nucleotidyltransferase n=1 Tax=Helicobacter valdiviensis TaxID=1458358 RepID=A0A2W6MVT7_9HELI|nr:phosphocholine cytidylyltransferase family protein [Helicobacter valdiviensis]PZT48059.1 sugar nucleotidyltransferase [Helicobacter valdiviensis]